MVIDYIVVRRATLQGITSDLIHPPRSLSACHEFAIPIEGQRMALPHKPRYQKTMRSAT
jgi:hypothetical protein